MAAVTTHNDLGVRENKIYQCFHFFPSICHEVMGLDTMILVFWIWSSSQLFHSLHSFSSRGSLFPFHFLPLEWYHLRLLIFLPGFLINQLEIHPVWHFTWCIVHMLPWWPSGKEFPCQCRRLMFNPWSGRCPWRRKWQLTPVFLPGKFHGQRSLVGYSQWVAKSWTWLSD